MTTQRKDLNDVIDQTIGDLVRKDGYIFFFNAKGKRLFMVKEDCLFDPQGNYFNTSSVDYR